MKKIVVLLSLTLVLGLASVTMAADPAKISGEVVYKMLLGDDPARVGDQGLKSWETAKLAASGNLNPQLSYTFGIKADMVTVGGKTNNWPDSTANPLAVQLDKAAVTYKHAKMPLTVTVGKSAIATSRTNYWDNLSQNLSAEGVALKVDASKNLSVLALVQPMNKDDDKYVALQNVFADYKTPVGEFGLNLKRSKAAGKDPVMDYSVEGTVPVPHTPVVVAAELVKLNTSDDMNYIVGAKATFSGNTVFVETTDLGTPFVYGTQVTTPAYKKGTAVGFSRNIAGADVSVKYATFENESSKFTGELKVKF